MKYSPVNEVSRLGYKIEVLYMYVEQSWPLSDDNDDVVIRNLAQLKKRTVVC